MFMFRLSSTVAAVPPVAARSGSGGPSSGYGHYVQLSVHARQPAAMIPPFSPSLDAFIFRFRIRMLPEKEISKASIAKIMGVSSTNLRHFVRTRKLTPETSKGGSKSRVRERHP